MEIDHIFCFVDSKDAAEEAVRTMGLEERYRRRRLGEGTANICCCFDNAYLEFLYLTDEDEARSEPTGRLGLFERARWRSTESCPFGIAWRGEAVGASPPWWFYRPPYLSADLAILVAEDSDDPRLPLLFSFPGTTRPVCWPAERRGTLQHRNGLGAIGKVELVIAQSLAISPALSWLCAETDLLVTSTNGPSSMRLLLEDTAGVPVAAVSLPAMSMTPTPT